MKHINRFVMFRDVDNPPLTKNVNTNFLYARPYNLHRLPVSRFIRKVTKIIKA